jgi:rubrerythrin
MSIPERVGKCAQRLGKPLPTERGTAQVEIGRDDETDGLDPSVVMHASLRSVFRRAFLVVAAPSACGGMISTASEPAPDGGDVSQIEHATPESAPPPSTSIIEVQNAADLDRVDACVAPDASAYPTAPTSIGCGRNIVGVTCDELLADGGLAPDRARAKCADAGASTSGGSQPALYQWEGGVALVCFSCSGGGRKPDACELVRPRATTPLGAYFTTLAELEAVSVPAFEILAAELRAHGAPDLAGRAERAADEERVHAKMTRALANRFGGQPCPPAIAPRAIRPLVEIAIENAREGCVRETYGAIVAMHQARWASDRRIRRAMQRIARDEARHAELAWDVATFCASRLSREENELVASERHEALAVLATEIGEPHEDVARIAGMPRSPTARRLFEALAS